MNTKSNTTKVFSNQVIVQIARISLLVICVTTGITIALNELYIIDENYAYAQKQHNITASSIMVGESIILTITNVGNDDGTEDTTNIQSIKVWLDEQDNHITFKSFKTESGWVGQKVQQVITFTATVPLKVGDSVKFGIKTDTPISRINWMAIDQSGNQVAIAQSLPDDNNTQPESDPDPDPTPIITPEPEPDPTPIITPDPTPKGITSESDFRIIPARINVGDTIRVIGEKFGSTTSYEFYLDDIRLGTFTTDSDGNFITTQNLPSEMQADRVDFIIKDSNGDTVTRSLRVNQAEVRSEVPNTSNTQQQPSTTGFAPITISGIPNTAKVGDRLSIHGTATANKTIVVYMDGPDNTMLSSHIIQTDESGIWLIPKSYLIGANMKIGDYIVFATDGIQNTQKTLTVIFEEDIIIRSDKIRYDRSDTMTFNITTSNEGGESVKVELENPNNVIVYSNILNLNNTNSVVFNYNIEHTDFEGTYTLLVQHGNNKEFHFVGIDQIPTIKNRFELDKVNYGATDTATINIIAKPLETVKLNILDQSDTLVYTEQIDVQSDGKSTITLDLKEFENGIYTAEIEKGTEKTSNAFTIGQSGATTINITPVKPRYYLGEQILVSIDTGDRIAPLTIDLIDVNGNVVNTKESFSNFIREKDMDRSKALETLQVPSSGSLGEWTIKVTSGGNSESIIISIIPRGISIHVSEPEGDNLSGVNYIDVTVIGAKQTVKVHIETLEGQIIGEEQKITITDENIAIAKILIPDDIVPGTYVLKAIDTHGHTAQTEVEING